MRLLDGDESQSVKKRHLWMQEQVTDREDDVQNVVHASSEFQDEDDVDLIEQALADLDTEETAADEITEDGAREILMTLIKQKIVSPLTCPIVRCSSRRRKSATLADIDPSMYRTVVAVECVAICSS